MDVLRAGETVHAPAGKGVINRILPVGKALVYEVLCEGQLYYYNETELTSIQ
ncbi:hypothetical protein [Zhaonella formicivorans]|uniref:hypothetical protein n=1 Tax=Zhaonella formicivorans TaxID=2528593 RepID=UPI001D0FE953|nr:hypothetical protein [Zhaonella formicivorans]